MPLCSFPGKSTLANVLIGEAVECNDCTFAVCDGHDSCTKNTKYAVGDWLGDGDTFTIVDTPGFGDSDNDENLLIDEMMDVLKNTIGGANAIILLLNGEEERFDASLQQMIREMQVNKIQVHHPLIIVKLFISLSITQSLFISER